MLCRICKTGNVPPNRLKKQDYICGKCHQLKYLTCWRKVVLDHYGRICVYCGTTENLQFDHVAGDGSMHKSASGKYSYTKRDRWLRRHARENFPPGVCQILCGKCNRAKGCVPDAVFRDWIIHVHAYLFGTKPPKN